MRSPQPFAVALGVLLASLAAAPASQAMAPIGSWTFESLASSPGGGPYAADAGSGEAQIYHAGASTYSRVTGNGTTYAISSNTWAVGDYYTFKVSSLNLTDLQISWDQTSSGTGPKNFDLQYSTDGTNYTTKTSYSLLENASPNWNAITRSSNYGYSEDFSAITALDNQTDVYFRLIVTNTVSANGGTIGAGGTSRIDSVLIQANALTAGGVAVPAPAPLLAAAAAFSTARRLRRRLGGEAGQRR